MAEDQLRAARGEQELTEQDGDVFGHDIVYGVSCCCECLTRPSSSRARTIRLSPFPSLQLALHLVLAVSTTNKRPQNKATGARVAEAPAAHLQLSLLVRRHFDGPGRAPAQVNAQVLYSPSRVTGLVNGSECGWVWRTTTKGRWRTMMKQASSKSENPHAEWRGAVASAFWPGVASSLARAGALHACMHRL